METLSPNTNPAVSDSGPFSGSVDMAPSCSLEELAAAYLQGTWRWTGCDWSTRFGPRKLDLCGLRADQARLWSQACQGLESKAWLEAAHFLDEVEQDALAAEQAAGLAFQAAQQGRLLEARELARQAVALEKRHRSPATWVMLLSTLDRLPGY